MDIRYLLLLITSTGLTALLNFLFQIGIAKNTSPQVYGAYSTYLTLSLISIPLITVGISNYLIKFFSEEGEEKRIDINLITLILLSSLLGLIVINFIFNFYFDGFGSLIAFLLSFGVLAFAYHEIYLSYLVGCENKKYIIFWQPILHFFRFLILMLFLYMYATLDFSKLAWLSFFVSILIIIFVVLSFRSKVSLNIKKLSIKKIGEVASKSIWFGLIGFLYILYSQINIVYIDRLIGSVEAGYFNIGYTFLLMSLILPTTFYNKYLLPKLHRLYKTDKSELKRIYIKGSFYSLIFGLIFCMCLNFLAENIVLMFYGVQYFDSIIFFKYIVFAIPLFYLSIHVGIFSYLGGFQKYKVYGLFFVTLVSLLINYILILNFGVIGSIVGLNIVIMILTIVYVILNKFFIFNEVYNAEN
ncbi:hypothetical protein D7V68_08175 [Acinetobacter cumulans]|uniref:oligosaccharide flippase family protein n=1 Tax=Acinetobacter cumulans TaxID=2136182 RepID=UPI000EA146B1|nr:oligosaccharide flippase family protein [Acinetobacter cumulans]RKG48571.1 hypothetical protein D7V68_08175 [Acinetobacter cumulans]